MAKLPTTMQAIVVNTPGKPDVMQLKSIPLPHLPKGWILIKVAYAGVNRPDCLQRAGLYPPPPDANPYLGLEVAGEIVAAHLDPDHPIYLPAHGKAWEIGDKVTALAPGGGYCEYCAVPASHALPIPKGFTMAQAAALPETYFTVYSNLFMRVGLKSGEHVLIHGGASGIGTTAIQMAKAFGAISLVTAGNKDKIQKCLELGAVAGFNYNEQDWVMGVKNYFASFASHKTGVDVVLDMVGAPYFERNIACLGLEGRLLQIAVQKGNLCEIDLRKMMLQRLTLTGSTLRAQSIEAKAKIAHQLYQNIWPKLDKGMIKPIIDCEFPLEDANLAHQFMESSKHFGKIILKC